jgi:hypothetical protein
MTERESQNGRPHGMLFCMDTFPREAHVEMPTASAASFAGALSADGIDYERAGVARGMADAVELFVLAVPSLAVLALVLEKLRRARLPRTYVAVRDSGIEIWTDRATKDGRIFVSTESEEFVELPDTTISADTLRHALDQGRTPES